MHEYVQVLIELGLTTLQSKVFLAMDCENYKTVKDISRTASVARQQIYRVLPELQKLGLVEERVGAPNQYRALPIKEVLTILVEREKSQITRIQEEVSKLKDDNSRTNLNINKGEDFEIKLITGLENIEKNFRALYESSNKISYIGAPRPWTFQASNRLHMDTYKLKKNVDHRMIYGPPPENPADLHSFKVKLRTVPFEIPMYIGLFDDKRVLFSLYLGNEIFAPADFSILSSNYPCLVKMMRVYFENMWKKAHQFKSTLKPPKTNRILRSAH